MHVTRQRREDPGVRSRLPRVSGRTFRLAVAGTAAVAVTGAGAAFASTTAFRNHQVGTEYGTGLQVSSDQVLKPIGDRLVTKFGKLMGSTVSPDGRFLAASSADKSVSLQVFDLKTYRLIYTAGTASAVNQKLKSVSVGQEAPTYSPDGKTLWLSQADDLVRFPVLDDGTLGTGVVVPLAKVGDQQALPGQPAYSADGATLYVPLNGQNTVVAMDPSTGAVQKTWQVGIAPREIAVQDGTLYVSNEGGRTARPGESTINSYGTDVPADPYLGTSTTGTVSVIDTAMPDAPVRSIDVGLHPTALYLKGRNLLVANTNSDTVSVVDTRKNTVVQTIATQPWPSSSVGYEPTDMTITRDGHLLVTLGRANAVAVYRWNGSGREPVGYEGLLPTDYYPHDLATTRGGQIVVTNTRGIDARGPELTTYKGQGTVPVSGHNTHSTTGSLTKFTLPDDADIASVTSEVFAQNGWGKNDVRTGKGATPVAVPKRLGDPSTIKHVFLLVKENRTYDQVYGDIEAGNGDATLTQFGEKATPNQHRLANQFGLYDNTYDIGTNSAEGHNWLMQGDNPEYTESSAGEYLRSYDTEDDVLGHQRSGFLWTAALSAGKSVRNYGEFMQFETKPAGATWQKYYCSATTGDPAPTDPSILTDTQSPIPSLNEISDHAYPKFDTNIPDIYRYQIWKQDFEKNGPANLNMFWLSSDHTGGTPDPEAQVADGDLAVGKIVDTISHSKYWKDSAIFVVEDDSQDGADHVDGHRAPVQIISPYAQRGVVDSTYYTQITMVRTIEQILGAQPLNQKLAAATPMYGAFTDTPDFRKFRAVPNRIPLTEGVATAPDCGLDTLGETGTAARTLQKQQVEKRTQVPAAQRANAEQWATWAEHQRFAGPGAVPDYANPEQMNRYTWYRTHDWSTPYPGDARIYAPDQVPGAYIPSADSDG